MSKTDLEERLRFALKRQNPRETYKQFIGINDLAFLSASLDNGRDAVNERTLIHEVILENWFQSLIKEANYQNPTALLTHGGSGRREITPCSDIDTAILVEDNTISKKLAEIIEEEMTARRESSLFVEKTGFGIHSAFYTLEDVSNHKKFDAKQVNSLCDYNILFDQGDLAPKFLQGVLKHRRLFSHLDHLVREWKSMTSNTKLGIDNLDSFNIKEDMGGLRHFQIGLRMPHTGSAEPLRELYPSLQSQNPDIIGHYDFLLKIRGWLHLRRMNEFKQNNNAVNTYELSERELIEVDTLSYPDYIALGEEFGSESQRRLLEARRAIANFADLEVTKTLKKGFSHDGITYGSQGVFVSMKREEFDTLKEEEKGDKLFGLLEVAQTQSLPVDLVEFIDMFGDSHTWIKPSKGFARLFYSGGQFPRSLELLNRIGVYNLLLPGASELEAAVPKGGHKGQFLTSTAFGRQKVADHYEKASAGKPLSLPDKRFDFSKTLNQLSLEDSVAVLLAYQTARIPQILEKPTHQYYSDLNEKLEKGFTERTLETARFLVENRDLLSQAVDHNLNNNENVERVARIIGSEEHLYALRVYMEIDLSRKNPNLPFIDELYQKVLDKINPELKKNASGSRIIRTNYSDEQLSIVDALGEDVIDGVYENLALNWIPRLTKVKRTSIPEIALSRTHDGEELHIGCKDSPGLLRLIAGKCYQSNLDIAQVHAYTLAEPNIVFDILHLSDLPRDFPRQEWIKSLCDAIKEHQEIDINPKNILRGTEFVWSLEDCHDYGLMRLTFETKEHKKGYLFALASALYSLDSNIYAAKSSRENGETIRVFFKSPNRDFWNLHSSLKEYFGR